MAGSALSSIATKTLELSKTLTYSVALHFRVFVSDVLAAKC